MRVSEKFVLRQIAEECILVPITGEFDFNGIIALNDMGKEIYELLPKFDTEEALINHLCEQFDAPQEVIAADAKEFLEQLRKEQILLGEEA